MAKFKHLLPDLHTDGYSLEALEQESLDHLFKIKDDYLQDSLRLYHWAISNGKSQETVDKLRLRCEDLQDTVSILMGFMERIQIHLSLIKEFEDGEKKFKDKYQKLPEDYAICLFPEIPNDNFKHKFFEIMNYL